MQETYHHPAISFLDDPPHKEFARVVVYCDIVDPIVMSVLLRSILSGVQDHNQQQAGRGKYQLASIRHIFHQCSIYVAVDSIGLVSSNAFISPTRPYTFIRYLWPLNRRRLKHLLRHLYSAAVVSTVLTTVYCTIFTVFRSKYFLRWATYIFICTCTYS